jgi:hypothetical protein
MMTLSLIRRTHGPDIENCCFAKNLRLKANGNFEWKSLFCSRPVPFSDTGNIPLKHLTFAMSTLRPTRWNGNCCTA